MPLIRETRVAGTIALSLILTAAALNASHADTWRGTAPFCAGHCEQGEAQVGSSSTGDGGYCVTGHKVLCRNAQATCVPRQTQTSCYGVVKVCDNGFHEVPTGNWHSCATYGCGVCLGISSGTVTTASLGGGSGGGQIDVGGRCKQGFVWREAIPNDRVCVTPATRSQSAADNGQAAQRRNPTGPYGPDTCKQGFVWREVIPADHVCVTPAVRAAVAADTSAARERVAGP